MTIGQSVEVTVERLRTDGTIERRTFVASVSYVDEHRAEYRNADGEWGGFALKSDGTPATALVTVN